MAEAAPLSVERDLARARAQLELERAQANLKPAGLPELTRGFVTRGSMEAVGGTLGAVAGGSAGGVAGLGVGTPVGAVAGMMAGGALGAAGGSAVFDNTEDFLRWLGVLREAPGGAPSPINRTAQIAGEAARAGYEDALYGGAFIAGGALLGGVKPLIGKILGVRQPEVVALVEEAKRAGLVTKEGNAAVGAMDIVPGARGTIMRGYSKVAGVFPFIAGPLKKSAKTKAEAIIGGLDNLLNTLSPTATLSDDLGLDMVAAAKGAQKEFRTTAGSLYDNFRELARGASKKAIVPTAPIKARVADVLAQAGRERILIPGAKPGKVKVIKGAAEDQLNSLLQRWNKLPEFITVDQLQGQANLLKDIINKAAADGYDVSRFITFKKGMEEALGQLNLSGLPKAEAEAIQNAKTAADSFFAKGIAKFQTPTAQKFGGVDKNIFSVGPMQPGRLNEDELARVAVNLRSPQAIRDLTALVGAENMGKAARLHIEKAWDQAAIVKKTGEISGFDWNQFKRSIGLTRGKNIGGADTAEGLREFVKQGGVDLTRLDDLIDIASRIEIPGDVATMVARRAVLGGAAAGISAVSLMKLVPDSMVASTGVALLFRHAAKIFSNPSQLAAMQRALTPSTPTSMKRQLIGRLLENFGQSQQETGAGGAQAAERSKEDVAQFFADAHAANLKSRLNFDALSSEGIKKYYDESKFTRMFQETFGGKADPGNLTPEMVKRAAQNAKNAVALNRIGALLGFMGAVARTTAKEPRNLVEYDAQTASIKAGIQSAWSDLQEAWSPDKNVKR